MNVCPVWFCERGYKTNNIIESSKQVITKKNCNYLDYKWSSLVTEPCQDYSCENCFHHSCQNDYDTERYADEYDKMHGLKKHYKSCVDKMMKVFYNSLKKSSDKENKNHLIKKFIILFQITINQKIFMIMMQLLLTMMIIIK